MLARSGRQRGGFSYLELQVSMVLFAIAIAGVGPLTVVHSRHISRVEQRFPPGQTRRMAPAPTIWERKLGAAAEVVPSMPPLATDELLIDDGGLGYSQVNRGTYDWTYWNWSRSFQNDMRFNQGDNAGDVANWTFGNLQPGRYQVLVTWRPLWFMARDAEYEIYDGAKRVAKKKIDQRKWPDGPLIDGFQWKSLKTVDIKGNELRLQLGDKAKGYVAVDAARLIPVTNDLEVLSLSESPETNSAQAYIEMKVRVK